MRFSVRKLTFGAVIAAVYAVLTMALAPISYGPIQFRVSEVLCILPLFFPGAVCGLFVGCALANIISSFGIADVVFGSLATLIAGLATMWCGKKLSRVPAAVLGVLPPVVANAFIIGAVIAWASVPETSSGAFWPLFWTNALEVGLGELGVMLILGLPLALWLPRTTILERLQKLYAEKRPAGSGREQAK